MTNPIIEQATSANNFHYSRFAGGFWAVVLGSVGLIMHKKHVDVRGVLDKERLMAARHHVASLLVGTISDL